jgi:trimeric autotransporter adhesin
MKTKVIIMLVAFTLIGVSRFVYAQCPQTCDGNYNTALGNSTLLKNSGFGNTVVGQYAFSDGNGNNNVAVGNGAAGSEGLEIFATDNVAIGAYSLNGNQGSRNIGIGSFAGTSINGNDDIAIGYQALTEITTGEQNTATGNYSLESNTTGNDNTANGFQALASNTEGHDNTATGYQALFSNQTGIFNTATGDNALERNASGNYNTAEGYSALFANVSGKFNVASGHYALRNNTSGSNNTAVGDTALQNSRGSNNTAAGADALSLNTIGANNIAIGFLGGANLTTGSNNIDIGSNGVAAEANTIRIGTSGTQTSAFMAGIFNVPVPNGLGIVVDGTGHLGTVASSERFKEAIKPMDKASKAIFSLQPVTFRYKKELDPKAIPQFGLVAEQVEKVDPDLIARDNRGKPYSVRYEAVNAMLLNEFLKQHCKVEEQQASIAELKSTVAQQQKGMEVLTAQLKEQAAQIQKVSAQLEMGKRASQVVVNKP